MLSTLHSLADAVLKRMYRSPMYFQKYNNTLDFRTNRAYEAYAKECAELYAKNHPGESLGASPFVENAATVAHGAFPKEKAIAYSQKITDLIEQNSPYVTRIAALGKLSIEIEKPLESLGADILDVLRAPEVDSQLRAFFRGYYRVESLGVSRSQSSPELTNAWLWHSDSFPPHTCNLFLHLTPADADRGATEFLNLEDTMAYRRAGYFGQHKSERLADLETFAKNHHLPYRPMHRDAEPGDATLFNMNFFHRAKAPKTEFRDIVHFFFLPSPIPWDEWLRRDPGYLSREKSSGFPKNPAVAAAGVAQGMM